MGPFSQVPGLAGYQQQVALNDQQGNQQMMRLSQLMQMAQQSQAMRQAPEDLAMKRRMQNAQIGNYEAEAGERQAKAQKMQELFSLSKQISTLPQNHPERATLVQRYKMLADPNSAFAPPAMPKMRERIEGGRMIQEEFQPDGTFKKVGEGERFAKQIPSIVKVGDGGGVKAPSGYRFKANGDLEQIPGGPADQKSQQRLEGGGTVDGVVASLRDAYDQLDKSGGITNPKQGVSKNLIAGLSSSGAGQFVGKLLGSENQSMRNTIAQQRPLLLQAIMKATGMSAKQMDSNAELKLYLATATDPTLDVSANRRALDMIEQLYGSGAGNKSITGGGNKNITVDW